MIDMIDSTYKWMTAIIFNDQLNKIITMTTDNNNNSYRYTKSIWNSFPTAKK